MPEWAVWIQYVINGIVAGSTYILLGLGLTLVFGILWIISFVHGEFFMLGGFVAFYLLATYTTVPFLLSIPISMGAVGLLGALLGWLTINPLRNRHWEFPMLSTFGLSFVLLSAALMLFGGDYRTIPSPYTETVFRFSHFFLSALKLIVILVTFALFIALRWILLKTSFGRNLRATAQDRVGAAAVGINSASIYTWTFALACAIAAAGGVLVGAVFNIDPYMGQTGLLKGWVVIILGGMGNVTGAVIGGLAIGVIESLGTGLLGAGWSEAIAFGAMIVILLLRPQGLLGARRGV
jgi:branched-chain amino acid transport system permease protein